MAYGIFRIHILKAVTSISGETRDGKCLVILYLMEVIVFQVSK